MKRSKTKNVDGGVPVRAFGDRGRLSRSIIWQLQRNYFATQGPRAWSEGVVPSYVTSNPWIAEAYAKVIFGWLRDGFSASREEVTNSPFFHLDQPIYVVELGCGSGVFAYRFLKSLRALLKQGPLRDVDLRLVLTDFTEANLDELASNPRLRPFIEAGQLDFALYEFGVSRALELRHSGRYLTPTSGSVNPLAVIANYVFDSIPQDCFAIRDGQLHENLVAVTSPEVAEDHDVEEELRQVEISYEARAVNGSVYDDEDYEAILSGYISSLKETNLLFPIAALEGLKDLLYICGNRLLLLSADKGYGRFDMLEGREEPRLNFHGSFSLMVNYHAIGQYVSRRGGAVLDTTYNHSSLNVSAYLLGKPEDEWIETRLAFDDAIERHGPDDFFSLKRGIERSYSSLHLEEILAFLRFSGFDSNVLVECLPVLLQRVKKASAHHHHDLHRILAQVWEKYLPIHEKFDLAFHISMLFYETHAYQEALRFLNHSLELYGSSAATYYNMALCLFRLGEKESALGWVDRSLELDPVFEPAGVLRIKLGVALSGSSEDPTSPRFSSLPLPAQ